MNDTSAISRHVASQVRRYRILSGLTQRAFADLLGVRYYQVHKYESGKNRIAADRLWRIAQVLGVEVSVFFKDLDPSQTGTRAHERPYLELTKNYTALDARRRAVVRQVARLL